MKENTEKENALVYVELRGYPVGAFHTNEEAQKMVKRLLIENFHHSPEEAQQTMDDEEESIYHIYTDTIHLYANAEEVKLL